VTIIIPQDAEQRTSNRATRPERRGVSHRSVIEEAKRRVPVAGLANSLASEAGSTWRRSGGEWVTNCPLPDHPDRTPSVNVNPSEGVWFCYGCLRGGDVVELARFAWGYSKDEVAMAAADMLDRFGHDVPCWTANRQRKHERQAPVRDAIEKAKINSIRRRLYRLIFLPMLEEIEDLDERTAEARQVWEETEAIARMLRERRKAKLGGRA
jgi:hypothetical protein